MINLSVRIEMALTKLLRPEPGLAAFKEFFNLAVTKDSPLADLATSRRIVSPSHPNANIQPGPGGGIKSALANCVRTVVIVKRFLTRGYSTCA